MLDWNKFSISIFDWITRLLLFLFFNFLMYALHHRQLQCCYTKWEIVWIKQRESTVWLGLVNHQFLTSAQKPRISVQRSFSSVWATNFFQKFIWHVMNLKSEFILRCSCHYHCIISRQSWNQSHPQLHGVSSKFTLVHERPQVHLTSLCRLQSIKPSQSKIEMNYKQPSNNIHHAGHS